MRATYLKARMFFLVCVQSAFGKLGLQIRRLKKNVSVEDSVSEMVRLAGPHVRTIVEFGAADGRDTEDLCRRFPQATVIGVEPVPASFKKLAERQSRCKNLIVEEAAIGNQAGTATLFLSSEPDASSISPPVKTGSAFDKHAESIGKLTVTQMTLDSLCEKHQINSIDILKMDAQGAELEALEGARRLLAGHGIRVIYSEIQFIRLYEKACLFHELWAFLETHGFYLHGVYGFSHNEHGQLCWGDALFVHETARPPNATLPFSGKKT